MSAWIPTAHHGRCCCSVGETGAAGQQAGELLEQTVEKCDGQYILACEYKVPPGTDGERADGATPGRRGPFRRCGGAWCTNSRSVMP